MTKKYKLTDNTITHYDKTLHQIQALRSFGNVAKGDLGGYVEKEGNLSHEGNAWVSGNAWVYGNAWVFGNADVSENACVYGNAGVYGNAEVFGNAWVYGNAEVYGNACVYGNAGVSGNAEVFGDADVYGNAEVYGNAWVFGDARVSKGKCTEKIVNFIGLEFNITAYNDIIKVGCKTHTCAEWTNIIANREYESLCEDYDKIQAYVKLLLIDKGHLL